MRFYEQKYPEAEELVMVQVKQIQEMGAYVKLLEYDNIEGMIQLSELSRRRIRSVQKLIRVGRNEVVLVMRVDKEKGYIDLSKRRVTPEELVACEERFLKSRSVASILRQVASKLSDADFTSSAPAAQTPAAAPAANAADHDGEIAPVSGSNEDNRLRLLYETIAWPLGKQSQYNHPLDAFKLILTEPDRVFDSLPVQPSPAVRAQLTAIIARRLTPQPVKLRADIEVTCNTPAGIDAIKRALRAGEKQSSESVPIKIRLIRPPLYVMDTNATDKNVALTRLERAIEIIQETIKKEGGNLVVVRSPKAVSDSEDHDLKQLMAKAEAENAEVAGDDDADSDDGM